MKQRQLKSQDENGKRKMFLYPCCLKFKLGLIVISTNLEYRENESRATGQLRSTRKGARAREKKEMETLFVGGTT